MSITFYKLLAPVLARDIEFVVKQRGISKEKVYKLMLKEAENNQKEWYSSDVPKLNYKNPICRLSYLYIIVASNANIFKYILEENQTVNNYIKNIISSKMLKVCSLGGGPGTELLGIVKFFSCNPIGNCDVDFQVLDKVQEWANSWYGIRDSIFDTLTNLYGTSRAQWPIIPSGNFIPCDVTNPSSIKNAGNIWNQDLYLINFLLSEVFIENAGFNEFMRQIVAMAPKGALFLFIERKGAMWKERIQQIAQEAGIALQEFTEAKLTKDGDECPEDLGEVFNILAQHRKPRLTWNITYCVGIK